MTKGLVAERPGGPDVLTWADLDLSDPGSDEVLVRHTAIGVNFIDVYYRSGLYKWPADTMIPGAEAAGVVESVGPDVTDFVPGERVAYTLPNGAYRQRRVVPAERLVKVPDAVSDETAASVMVKGLTAQYLVTASYVVKPGDTVLVHAAAGGVGLLLGQWLKTIGAHAIGTAGSPEKVELALRHGYEHVINYREQDFVPAVMELTDGKGCAAVYDSVGKDTWRGSLKCLRRLGMFVNFGQSSGLIEGFSLADLAAGGSLSANRPILFDYIHERADLVRRSEDLFRRLSKGEIRADIIAAHPLEQAASVHAALEARQTVGANVLIP